MTSQSTGKRPKWFCKCGHWCIYCSLDRNPVVPGTTVTSVRHVCESISIGFIHELVPTIAAVTQGRAIYEAWDAYLTTHERRWNL